MAARIRQAYLIDREGLISDLVPFLVLPSPDINAVFGVRVWRRRHIWRSAIHVSTDLISATRFEFAKNRTRLSWRELWHASCF